MEMGASSNIVKGHREVTGSVELVFVGVFLYNCICWGQYKGVDAKMCGLLAIAYIANGWITARSTFRFYGGIDFLSDVILFLLFCWVPRLLAEVNNRFGYDPLYWIVISGVEVVFVLWDILTRKKAPSSSAKREIALWTVSSVISVLAGIIGYFSATAVASPTTSRIVTGIIWMWLFGLIIVWNIRRWNLNKNKNIDFFAD